MTRLRPDSRNVAIAAGVFFVVYTAALVAGRSHGETFLAIDDVILAVVSVPPLVFSVLAVRATRGRLRSAWSTLAVGLLSWNLAEVIWTVGKYIRHNVPGPSLADVFFLFWTIATAVALLHFWNRRPGQSDGRVVLDGFIVAGSLFLVSWVLNMSDVFRTGAASKTEFIIAMAYPVTEWMLVTVAAIVLVNVQPRLRVVLTLMTLGLLSMAVNTSGYAYLSALLGYSSAAVVDIGWVAGLLLMTVAAAYGREVPSDLEPATESPGWASVWLPYAPLMAAAAVLAYGRQEIVTTPLVKTIGLLLVVAVLARQFLAVRENRRLLAAVSAQALRDPLTGLANRKLFAERLTGALRRRKRTSDAVAVVSLDLDNFKMINDTLGHAAGDEMLRCVGERIGQAVPGDGTVARVGGDEFAVLVEGDAAVAETVADRLFEAFETPISVSGFEMPMRPSIGHAVAISDRPDVTAEDMLLEADMAMYATKRSRSAAPDSSTPAQPIELLRELRRAVDAGDLSLVYQPKFDLDNEAVVGVEALLRWQHTKLGILTLDQIPPLIRVFGLVEPVTDFIVHTALDDARRWHAGGVSIPIAVNIVAPSLPTLADRLDGDLRSRGLAGSALTVEMAEHFFADDVDRTRQVLSALRNRGIRVAIDDFGTGYSALQYLRDLPVDEVKLARALIAPVAADPRAAAVAHAAIDLIHALGITTVAEAVENAETADWLKRNGCDIAQGCYFSRPLSAAEIPDLCR